MTFPTQGSGTIHSSVFGQAASAVRRAAATMRGHGALRYQCPVTDSFILVTDDATLASLAKPQPRIRCADCGEMHLLTHE
ncbi:MAG TPA: hypothetical protein VGM57_11445 [Pseudolabrys sp.]